MDLKADERRKLELELVRLDREYYKPPPLPDYWEPLSELSDDEVRALIANHPSRAKGDQAAAPSMSGGPEPPYRKFKNPLDGGFW